MKYFISLVFVVCSPYIWGMDGDFMFTADDFISSAEFKRRLEADVKKTIQEYRENLPEHLKKGLPEPEEYNSEDYEDVKTPEGLRRYEEASEAFDKDGPEAPAYKASEAIHRAKRQARLEREARLTQQVAPQQLNGHHEDLNEGAGDDATSSIASSDFDDTSSFLEYELDIADRVVDEAKVTSNPLSEVPRILHSLGSTPVASPSKSATIKVSLDRLKRANWGNLTSLPHNGWTLVEMRDLKALTGRCDLCNHRLRYCHILSHPELEETICTGETCAKRFLKNQATIASEKQIRLSSNPTLAALMEAFQSLSVE